MVAVRLQRLREKMREQELAALLITNPYNRQYMTGFTGSSGYVIITEDQALLLTDFRYVEQAAEQVQHYEIIQHEPKPLSTIRTLLNKMNVQRLGIEASDMTYSMFLDYEDQLDQEIVPSGQLVEQLRKRKDQDELHIMQEAMQLADKAFEHILTRLKPGVSEKQISAELEYFMRLHGATSSSFDTIVASGARSALPHGVASDKLLQHGDFVTLDFGAYYKGYCSDLTRTVVLGNPSEQQHTIYHIVLEAQMKVLDGLRPGMTGKEADSLAREVIKQYGYGDHFGHGTGHGLGMEIHEAPRLSQSGDTVLEPGMVVTVEPGIYIAGFGGVRIEDDVVITDTGKTIMTQSTKQLLVID